MQVIISAVIFHLIFFLLSAIFYNKMFFFLRIFFFFFFFVEMAFLLKKCIYSLYLFCAIYFVTKQGHLKQAIVRVLLQRYLTLRMLAKISRRHFEKKKKKKKKNIFPRNIGLELSCKLPPNLHEWKISLSSAKLVHGVVKINLVQMNQVVRTARKAFYINL